MKFSCVAQAFEEIEGESSRLKITEILAHLFKKADAEEAAIIAYMSLGSFHPPYRAKQFNFASSSMQKVFARFFDIEQTIAKKKIAEAGDVGLAFSRELEDKSCIKSALSIQEVNVLLEQFLSLVGQGSQKLKEDTLLKMLKQLDTLSGKFVIRIILGKLRLGFSDMTLLDAFSWMLVGDKSERKDLETAYNMSADIGLIIRILKEQGLNGIENISITPGIPIRPAAAERLSDARAIIKKLGRCAAQPKLDGFRLQVHLVMHKGKEPFVRFFSRNLQDMSFMFPDLSCAVKDIEVETLIAEGEAICYDADSEQFLPFQETVKRKRKYDIETVMKDYPLKLYFFDILYVNGTSLINRTHEQRRKEMLRLLSDRRVIEHNTIFPIDEHCVDDADTLEKLFHDTVMHGLEGLVVKRLDAVYQPGKRNFNWIKYKREESGYLDDSIDCVILGYYFGRGKRANFGIGALLVGIYNKDEDCFQTVAKIGTGLSDEQWQEQKKACDTIKVDKKPANVDCAKDLVPDVWVMPQLVCSVLADEITKSPVHRAASAQDELGLALRFPRFISLRSDKSAQDATTDEELLSLYKLQFQKKQRKVKKNIK